MRRFCLALLMLLAACSHRAPASDPAAEKMAILKVIADMEAAWNRGDFRGYMAGFKKPDVMIRCAVPRTAQPCPGDRAT